MLEDVLTALAGVPALAGIIVVTREASLAAIARSFDAHVIADLRHEGPSAAIMPFPRNRLNTRRRPFCLPLGVFFSSSRTATQVA